MLNCIYFIKIGIILQNIAIILIWGCFGFDREYEMLFISVCVAQIYIKSWKKINADSDNIGASNFALAA